MELHIWTWINLLACFHIYLHQTLPLCTSLAAAVLKKNKAHSRRLNHRLTYTIDHLLSTVTSFFFYYDAIPNSKIQLYGFL